MDYSCVWLVHFFSFFLRLHAGEKFIVTCYFVSILYPVLSCSINTLDSTLSPPISMFDLIYYWFDLTLTKFPTRRSLWKWGWGCTRSVSTPPVQYSMGMGSPSLPNYFKVAPLWVIIHKGCGPNVYRSPPLCSNPCGSLGVHIKTQRAGARLGAGGHTVHGNQTFS